MNQNENPGPGQPTKKPAPPIDRKTFWRIIDCVLEGGGQEGPSAFLDGLDKRLRPLGPEAVLEFDCYFHAYMDLAYQYGLWGAAGILCNGCSDDGFIDFRAWLVSRGETVYMAALADPDSLTDAPVTNGCRFESICGFCDTLYENMTGRNPYEMFNRAALRARMDELRPTIAYGEGVNYPYRWSELRLYLPKLCDKYVDPKDLDNLIAVHDDPWNPNDPDIREAKANNRKHPRVLTGGAP